MEKFQNITSNNKEKAIKIGNSVPDNGVPISWFSTKEISPKNNIVTLDLSETIPENTPNSTSDNEAFFAVSEELGFLKTVDNDFSFSSDQLTISNIPLHKPIGTDYYDLSTENPNDFAHYFYVSRYFIPAPSNFFYTGINQYLDPDKLGNLKLKVLDANGVEYVDQNTGRKKYRIMLEPYITAVNRLRYETPHRVIVLLDADEPISLKLNYDKTESDQDGNMFHLELNYLETINAIPIFSEVPEESFVIDPNYSNDKQFSIKKINQKYSDLIENTKLDTGYQIIAPGKPVDDNRTFESFNWRLIARSNKNVNLSQINDQIGSQLINKTIKAAIIYSSNTSQENSTIYPYVFRRLQDSPFNLSQFNFINPLQEPGYGNGTGEYSKDDASYWKVDIDSVLTFDDFDILLWSPDVAISENQALKLKSFITKNGTLLVDLSYLSINASALSPQLSMSSNRVSANYEFEGLASTTLYENTYNGGWNIVSGIFEKPEYGVFGSRYNFNTSTYKEYYYFNNTTDANEVLSLGLSEDGSDSQPVSIHIKSIPDTDALVSGNLIGVTTRLMAYCNSIYSISSPEQVIDSNTAATYSDVDENNYYSSILEGPFKFLYNIVSYTAYCRLQASRETRTNSSLYNFVTNWHSSWVMDSKVLWQDEIDEYFTPLSVSAGSDVYARKLSSSTIIDFYKDQFSNFMMSHNQDIAFGDLADIELFIECTNDDVMLSNCDKIEASDVNINSSYSLHTVLNNNEPVYAYATTSKTSPALTVPEGLGPYTILSKMYSSSNSALLKNNLNILSNFKSYPFSLETKYTYLTATDKPSVIDASFTPTVQMLFQGTLTQQVSVTTDEPATTQLVDATLNCQNFKSAVDDLGLLRETVSSKPGNIFLYSGDIDIHKDTRLWKNGSPTHEYVKYIQYTVSAANNSAIKIDGIYGSQTAGAVLTFQRANGERYLDGTVDSETKSYLARYWKSLKSNNLTKYNQLRTATLNDTNLSVITKYIDAIDKIGLTSDINTKTYKKLTFSGFSGPGEGMDILYFKIPNTIQKVGKIVIEADSNQVWRNFSVVQVGYSSSYSTDIFKYTVKAVNKTAATGTIEIPMNNIAGSNARYLWVHIIGNSLTGYGYAEGFSIKSIKVFGKVAVTNDPDPVTSEETVTRTMYALATVNLEDTMLGVSPSQSKIISYTTSSFPRLGGEITALTIDAKLDGTIAAINILPNGPVNVDSSQLSSISLIDNLDTLFLNNKFKINFSNPPILIWANGVAIDSFSNDGLEITNGTPIEISYSNAADKKSVTLTGQTSSTYYSDATFIQDGPNPISGYSLQKPNGTPLPGTRNATNASDGVLLLCNSDGDPVGLLDSLNIQNGVSGLSSAESQEVNTALGDLSVLNLLGEQDGFMYGFYDRNRLEFIGRVISYTELVSRGINNVFVAVCAYDADGNTLNQSEYIGPTSDTKFIVPRIPLKTMYPIYSVKMRRSSSIRVDKIDQNISKFDIWNLPISSGSFWKDVSIVSRPWTDWKSDYIGQTLKAFYTTFDDLIEEGSSGFESTGTVWSEIYGYGFYDIKDESPVILDDRTIQLRRTPLLKVAYPTSDLASSTGVIKHEIHIFTRETVSSSWIEVTHDLIRDIDSNTGIVKFRTRLVPSDKNLIKVNYVTANKNRMIHQLNGEMIPLNPLFSSLMTFDNGSKATFDVPLYIYLKPKAIYKQQNLADAINISDVKLTKITDYTCDKTIGFTYNSAIFNKNVSEYDPFALPIAIIYVTNNPYRIQPNLYDVRVRGGGVDVDIPTSTLIESVPEVLSNWDVYPPSGMAYARGGYVIIRIPASVKDHFLNEKEIYQVISNNLTAGIAYELQDMDGNSWN